MSGYRLCDGVVLQKNARIADADSVLAGVCSGLAQDGFNAEGTFMSLSMEGQHYLLNLSASLILEGLLAGENQTSIADSMVQVFEVSLEQAVSDIKQTEQELIEGHFIINTNE